MRFVASVLLMVFIVTFYFCFRPPDIRQCYRDQQADWTQNQSFLLRLDDVLNAPTKPTPGRGIFFIDAYCRQPMPLLFQEAYYGQTFDSGLADVDVLGACAIEAAAMHNPRRDVYLLYASPVYVLKGLRPVLLDTVLSYDNVKLRNVDLWTYASGTPVQKWLESNALFNSNYVRQHVASLLSFLTLWRYGGTYVSLDSIMTSGIADLPPNYVGVGWNSNLLVNFMNFASTGLGSEIAQQCLQVFEHEFNGSRSDSGQRTLKRVLASFDKANDTFRSPMDEGRTCRDGLVQHASYVTVETQWTYFFRTRPLVCALKGNRFKMSSKQRKVKTNFRHFYMESARIHCPRVSQLFVEYMAAISS